jgi:nicotinate-nucleotide adenylyltransferase
MRIGLFGGTFDPPHQAHLAASLLALKRLKLDRVWWLVTPGNPLKNTSGLGPLKQRIATARALTHHPRIDVTGLEAVINTRYTFDTISWLQARCPRVRFVWVMGADNLRSFHRWQNWRRIARLVPFVVIDRLGPSLYAAASPAGQALAYARVPEHAASSLPDRKAPAWTFLHGLKSALSSTALRALRGKSGKSKSGKTKSAKTKTKSAKAKSAKTKSSKRRKPKSAKHKVAKLKRTKLKSASRKVARKATSRKGGKGGKRAKAGKKRL